MNLIEFIEHRKEIKKPMTARAVKMLEKKLSRLQVQGYDPDLVLERSMINGWQDVYPHDSCKYQKQGFIEKHMDTSWADDFRKSEILPERVN